MNEWDFEVGPRGPTLRICEWGEARSGPPTLILHGFLEQGAAWDRVARQLPGRVVAPDHRGHGLSGHVGAGGFYHFWDYVSDVDALVRRLGGTVDLVGHSMGGTIASYFAGCRPQAVRRLVLVEGLGPPDLVPIALQRSRKFLDDLAEPRRHNGLANLDDAVRRMRRWNTVMREDDAQRLAARITRPIRPGDPYHNPDKPGRLIWTWDPLHRCTSPAPFSGELFRVWLRGITAPTLLVDGADSLFRVADREARASCIGHRREIAINGAGHLVHHDRPEDLARVIRHHLED